MIILNLTTKNKQLLATIALELYRLQWFTQPIQVQQAEQWDLIDNELSRTNIWTLTGETKSIYLKDIITHLATHYADHDLQLKALPLVDSVEINQQTLVAKTLVPVLQQTG